MKRDKHSKKHGNNWKNNTKHDFFDDRHEKKVFFPTIKSVTPETIRQDEEAIREFKKNNHFTCPKCNNPIADITTAIFDPVSNSPVHFDCILTELTKKETLEQGDRIAYIGQGRFGILNYPNSHDNKHFTIKKIIELESKENKASWREEMSELFSKVK